MTVINDMIRRARENPPELVINENQVGTVVEHCRALLINPLSSNAIEDKLRKGTMKFMDIPVRVSGNK